ncbi:hypothetical protein UY3_03844 [Chelonia mydas]|uniref:Uncharacterized protein n=1 Tax=Chelonia mydas TaxID=8469 RepID=M7BM29_CHEMY|nr:hypothetical protein UY3_03844 [Chelonia mydas]
MKFVLYEPINYLHLRSADHSFHWLRFTVPGQGGCGKWRPAHPLAAPLSAAPIGLERRTTASGSCNRLNLQMLQQPFFIQCVKVHLFWPSNNPPNLAKLIIRSTLPTDHTNQLKAAPDPARTTDAKPADVSPLL